MNVYSISSFTSRFTFQDVGDMNECYLTPDVYVGCWKGRGEPSQPIFFPGSHCALFSGCYILTKGHEA
jgi:hypothetical protein